MPPSTKHPDWPTLIQTHAPLVWATIYRLLPHTADAADCFQETFLHALQFAQKFPVTHWPALLQKIATARALDHLRARHRRSRHLTPIPNLAELPAANTDPVALAHTHELATQLRHALLDLPPQQAHIYCLRHLNNLSYEEIATQLNLTSTNVGVTLHRATQTLRTALTPHLSLESQR